MNLKAFAALREQAAAHLDGLAGALTEAPGGQGDARAQQLAALSDRTRNGRFAVLLVGAFSSGKSTLLNALLGRPVLPVKVNPCTAILTEVTYGEVAQVAVHHRDGRVEDLGLDEFTARYQLEAAAVDQAGEEVSDRFGEVERAVVRWPLELVRDGVVMVDTPGLDDDPQRTARTLSRLPEADAVIFVLCAPRFLSELERRTLQSQLLPLGLTNLFFPTTMVDLLDALSDDPEADLVALNQRARDVLGPLADGRLEERFFPMDARSGLHARWDRKAKSQRDTVDVEALEASGLQAFERSLSRFLVEERGHARLAHVVGVAQQALDHLEREAAMDRQTAATSLEELERRLEELEPQLARLDAIARRVGATTDHFIDRQKTLIWQDLRDFLAQAEEDLPEAVAGFDLGAVAGLDLLTGRGRERVEFALKEQLQDWLEQRVAAWQEQLRPTLERRLEGLRDELVGEGADFSALSEEILRSFSGTAATLPGVKLADTTPDPVERWFSVAVGAILLSPGAVAAGWSQGYEGAIKGAASRLGVRLAVITLGALLGPVGWVGLALYAVSDAVLLVLTGGGQLRRLKQRVAESLQGQLVAQADAAREEVEQQAAEAFQPLRDALVAAATADAVELRGLLERTISARAQAAQDAQERKEAWERALTQARVHLEGLSGLLP